MCSKPHGAVWTSWCGVLKGPYSILGPRGAVEEAGIPQGPLGVEGDLKRVGTDRPAGEGERMWRFRGSWDEAKRPAEIHPEVFRVLVEIVCGNAVTRVDQLIRHAQSRNDVFQSCLAWHEKGDIFLGERTIERESRPADWIATCHAQGCQKDEPPPSLPTRVADCSPAKRPELEFELVGAVAGDHFIDKAVIVEQHKDLIAGDVHARKY
jgi:hypothetical protein